MDLNPLDPSRSEIRLNETDERKAEILRRYRLFSYQPDEMITFRALGQMRPGEFKFDPRLYQYGGLWIYPVGAMLQLASMAGAVELTPDLAFYLEHPEAFGRFYVVARLYTVMWGLVGIWAVFWIVRRQTGSDAVAGLGAMAYVLMPVVVNMVHEAKPHLPGAVLMLLAIIAATKYVETGKTRWWSLAGVGCGGAFGMVISALPIFIVPGVMVFLRRDDFGRRTRVMIFSMLIGAATYFVTNPYVGINLLFHREIIESNIGNSTAMYSAGRWWEGILDGGRFLAEGLSPVLMTAGIVGGMSLLFHSSRRRTARQEDDEPRRRGDVGWLLATPAIVVTMQFIALAAEKPFEYARFGLFPGIALAIAACAGIHTLVESRRGRIIVFSILLALTAIPGIAYCRGFVRDARARTSRLAAAEMLREAMSGGGVLQVHAEPAPYILPPVDLFRWQWVLHPGQGDMPGVKIQKWPEKDSPTPMSWADQRFLVEIRSEGGVAIDGRFP